jgi:heterodisulfide reductase subunit A
MISLKLALMARRQTGARIFCFYVDMRATSKHGEDFYELAQREGVVFVHGKGTEVISREGKLLVKAEDTLLGRRVVVPVDMVVLSVASEPQDDAAALASLFGIGCSEQGFFMERHIKFAPVQTAAEGIFMAGTCQGPKDIPDCVAQGGAAAAGVLGLLDKGSVEIVPTVARVDQSLCCGCLLCLADCPYHAIERAPEGARSVVRVNDVVCKSCGSCATTCPTGAISQQGYTSRQLEAEIRTLLAVGR